MTATGRSSARWPWRPTTSSPCQGSGLRGAAGRASRPDQVVVHPAGDTGAGAKPHYLVVNADESEPGTCKDIPLMLTTPHVLVEGVIIAAYAIRAHHAFIYVRGEVVPVLRRLQAAVAEAYDAGYLGTTSRLGLRPGTDRARRARAPTSAARKPHCWIPWRAAAASRGCGHRSPPSPVSTPARPWSTTWNPSPACRRSCSTAWTGSGRWAPRSRPASRCTRCRVTSPRPASTRRRWASRCANCSTTPAASAPDTR